MKLQSILCPNENICNEEALYFHREGEWISFDGYFNLFYLEKHHKYCNIDKLTLELSVNGISRVQVMHDKEVISDIEHFGSRLSIVLPYEEYERGVFYFRVLPKDSWSVKGHFEASSASYQPVHIAVNICTFRREKYVLRNMRSLTSFLDSVDIDSKRHEVSENMNVFIIDNGQTLSDMDEFMTVIGGAHKGLITVIPNANTGGTGGFSRGMVEAIEKKDELGITHLLMMDDDAVFDPDLFVRLYGFLSTEKNEYKEITVGGALMREDYQYVQHAAGEWFTDFKVINEHPLTDMRNFETCTADWMTGTGKEHEMYGAWWCCCYHMSAVTRENLPLPIFVHHDDIQFGMRQTGRGIVFLNGISVWHQGFETVFPGVKQYYNMRNTLITMQMYEPEILRKKMLRWTLRRYIGMLISYRYADCEFVYRGLMDFLKGREWLLASDPEAIHKQLMVDYKRICPMRELTDEEKKLVTSYNIDLSPDQLRAYYSSERFEGTSLKKLTFNGWILPAKRGLKVITPLNSPWDVFRQKEILLYEPASQKGTVVKRDNSELFKGIRRIFEMKRAIGKWERQ